MSSKKNIFVYAKYFFISKYGYISVVLLFVVWIGIFDNNSWVKRWKIKSENMELTSQIKALKRQSNENKRVIESFNSGKEYLEKYAREKYGMKQPDEDVFLFDQ